MKKSTSKWNERICFSSFFICVWISTSKFICRRCMYGGMITYFLLVCLFVVQPSSSTISTLSLERRYPTIYVCSFSLHLRWSNNKCTQIQMPYEFQFQIVWKCLVAHVHCRTHDAILFSFHSSFLGYSIASCFVLCVCGKMFKCNNKL